MAHRPLLFACAIAVCFSLAAQEPPEFPQGEDGCAGARVLEHLERHGDYGQMNPEGLLFVTRAEQQARIELKRQGLSGEAINGNVWKSLGPRNGAGRAIALAFHPTLPNITVIGTAGGGVWGTTDDGLNWGPLTDDLPNLSVGAIAYAPSNPGRIYLGTGEGGYASDFIPGIGLVTSNNGGDSWQLPETVLASMFYRINVHPANADELIVGTNRGALRSTNGANGPWTTVIASSPGAGIGYGDVTEIVRDPSNANVLYAATWDRTRWCVRPSACTPANTFASPTILKSTDGGVTWVSAATGFPVSTATTRVERISLALAPSSPNTLYALTALFDADSGATTSHVYKSVNGGASWTDTALAANDDPRVYALLGTQGWYDNAITVSPIDPNVVIAGGIYYARSLDGGASWEFPFTGASPHVDVHELRFHPVTRALWIANDGGIWISSDNANTASSRNIGLVTRQYYAMAMDRINRNRILGGTQDNGTNLRTDTGSTDWSSFSGGDGFQCFIHPDAPGVAFSTFQFAELLRTKSGASPGSQIIPSGPLFPADEKKPFFSVVKADPVSPSTMYLATTRVWKTTTAGESWMPLPTTVTAGGTWNEDNIRAVAVAPSHTLTMMVGKGPRVFKTSDGGLTWIAQNNGLPGRTVTNVEISPVNRDVAFATIGGVSGPSVYRTTDGGTTWNARADGLPSFTALVIRFDPTDASTLYVGTDVGVYRTTNSGETWSRFGTGLPAVSVYDLQILSDGSMFRAATHGRGMWELQIAGVTNAPPLVSVTSPAPFATVARGAKLTFTGTASDPNGDSLGLEWTFPDDWSSKSGATATHTFDRAGSWPVSFTATDANGAAGGAQVMVTVTEPADDCATPHVVPESGPFPYSVTFNAEVAGAQQGLDPGSGGSCYPFRALRSFWLTFTPAVSGTYTFSLCTSRVAGFLSAYSGPACGPHVALPMCVTNTSLAGNCAVDPSSSMELVAGQQYRFFAGTYYSNSFGPITVTIDRGSAVTSAIRSVSPATGSANGGETVLITGSGFGEGATVRFGGVDATQVTVISPTLIRATVPPHAAGNVDVQVRMGAVTVTSAKAFTYTVAAAETRKRGVRH